MTDAFQAPVARDLVIVEGPDATSFLQSLVSQDLETIEVGASAHALFLQPQGKLLVDFYVRHEAPDTWWCVCESGFGAALAEGLSRFKIRVKADVRRADVTALAVRGARPPEVPGAHPVAVEWSGAPAFDVLGDAGAIAAVRAGVDLPVVDDASYERARVEAGVARQGFDVDDRTIPQEAGLERSAVSFTKGCFVGQELVCRIDTRGHVNRNLRRLRAVEDRADLPRAAPVRFDGREVGAITTGAGSVALAMLRREVEPGSRVEVDAQAAVVEAL